MAAKKKATKRPAKATKKAPKKRVRRAGPQAGKKGTAGRPRFSATDEHRRAVVDAKALGWTKSEILPLILNPETGKPIDQKTFDRQLGETFKHGARTHLLSTSAHLHKQMEEGSTTAAIWLEKTRHGVKERTYVEVDTKAGVLIAPAAVVSVNDYVQKVAQVAAQAKPPGDA